MKLKGRVIVGALIALAVAVSCVFVSVVFQARENAEVSACIGNQRQVSMGLKLYAEQHDGRYPPALAAVGPYVGNHVQLFSCPSAHAKVGRMETVEQWADYTYVAGFGNASPSDGVVLFCNPGNHPRGMVIVTFVDGHCDWMEQKELIHRLAARQNRSNQPSEATSQ